MPTSAWVRVRVRVRVRFRVRVRVRVRVSRVRGRSVLAWPNRHSNPTAHRHAVGVTASDEELWQLGKN